MPITLFKMRLKLYMLVTLGFLLKIRLLQLWCQYDIDIYGGTCTLLLWYKIGKSFCFFRTFFRTIGFS